MAGGSGTDIGFYTLPVILSFDGIEKNVNSKLGKVFGDVGKKSSKAFADSTESDLKRATDAYGKLRDKAADALGKVRVEEERLKKAREGGKLDQIAIAEERLNKARRDSTRTNKEAAASHDSLAEAQRRLGSASSTTAGGLSGMKDAIGGLVTKMGGVAAIAAGAAAAIGVVAAAAIAGAKEIYDLGARFDEVSDKLAIKTGATGVKLEALNDTIKKLAPSTASSISAIGDVVGSVSQGIGLTGDQLAAVSKNILDLDRMTGEQTNVRELGKAWRAFGVTAEQQVGTLDQLLQASQATGLPVNSLIETVSKAGPALREFGFSFGQSAALVGTLEQSGLDADTALGGLRVALKNVAKDGKDPQEALKGTVAEIGNLIAAGRDAEAITLTASVFGKGYLPFFDAIKRGDLDLQTLNRSLTDNGETIQGLSANTQDWSEKWQMVKNSIETAIAPTAGVFFDAINASLADLGNWVIEHQDEVIGFFVGLGNAAITATEFVVKAMGGAARSLGEIIAPIGDVLGGLMKFQAFVDEHIRGDQKAADESNKLAESYFSMGDGLKSFADRAESFNADKLRATLNDAGEKAKAAGNQTSIFRTEVDQLDGKGVDVPITVSGLDNARQQINSIFQIGPGATVPGIGSAAGMPIRRGAGPGAPGKGLTENSNRVKGAVAAQFPAVTEIGGYRPTDVTSYGTFNEHATGQAVDVMVPNWSTPEGSSYGDQIAAWALQNADALGVDYVIWKQRTLNANGKVTNMATREGGNPTANHMDHVHIHTVAATVPDQLQALSTPTTTSNASTPAASQPSMVPGLDTSGSASKAKSSPALDLSKLNTQAAEQGKKVGDQVQKSMGGKGAGGLGELGSIASNFLKDTFGLGSFLPALDSLMPLQMANTIVGAFDWSTMGFSPEALAAKAAAQGTTSNSAFGIPDIAAPPMPQGDAHPGSGGMPGPGNIINVDNSQNFNNSPVGSDPAAVEKARQANINRAPRLPIGMG